MHCRVQGAVAWADLRDCICNSIDWSWLIQITTALRCKFLVKKDVILYGWVLYSSVVCLSQSLTQWLIDWPAHSLTLSPSLSPLASVSVIMPARFSRDNGLGNLSYPPWLTRKSFCKVSWMCQMQRDGQAERRPCWNACGAGWFTITNQLLKMHRMVDLISSYVTHLCFKYLWNNSYFKLTII